MKASKRHLALVVLAALMTSQVLILRFKEASRGQTSDRSDAKNARFCVGVGHPGISSGLVCARSVEQVVPRAVDRLHLPPACAQVSLPASLRSGTPCGRSYATTRKSSWTCPSSGPCETTLCGRR